MLAKWEIYGIVAVVLVLAAIAAGAWQRHIGYEKAVADMQAAVDKANAKSDAAQKHLQELSDAQADRIEKLSTTHESELAAVSSTLRNRLCASYAGPGQVPAARGTPGVPAPAEPGPTLPQDPADPRFVPGFVKACQHDADSVDGWNEWWIEQRAALKAAFPDLTPAD